jgi:predicted transcriptional regulator
MNPSHSLGDLQYSIMRILWSAGEATVAEVHEQLEGDRALTTIATMLSKMEKKGVVTHRSEGRQFVYEPLVSEQDVRRTMVGDLKERLFQGDVAEMVSHLIREEDIDPTELERLEKLIEAARGKGGAR